MSRVCLGVYLRHGLLEACATKHYTTCDRIDYKAVAQEAPNNWGGLIDGCGEVEFVLD